VKHRVRFDWGPTGAEAIAAGAEVDVVVDVLSFTSINLVLEERERHEELTPRVTARDPHAGGTALSVRFIG